MYVSLPGQRCFFFLMLSIPQPPIRKDAAEWWHPGMHIHGPKKRKGWSDFVSGLSDNVFSCTFENAERGDEGKLVAYLPLRAR